MSYDFNNIVVEYGLNTAKDILTNNIKAGLFIGLGQIKPETDLQKPEYARFLNGKEKTYLKDIRSTENQIVTENILRDQFNLIITFPRVLNGELETEIFRFDVVDVSVTRQTLFNVQNNVESSVIYPKGVEAHKLSLKAQTVGLDNRLIAAFKNYRILLCNNLFLQNFGISEFCIESMNFTYNFQDFRRMDINIQGTSIDKKISIK